MSNDSGVFVDNTLEQLRDQDYELSDSNIFRKEKEDSYYPLWEAKFYHQFDHRFGTFEGIPEEKRFTRRAGTNRVTEEQKRNPDFEILPRYWVNKSEFESKKGDLDWNRDWIFTFREIARVTSDRRTAMGTIIPMHPCGHKAPVVTIDRTNAADSAILFTTFFTSFTFDFALRQSLGGTSVSKYILKQLPMPTPETVSELAVSNNEVEESLDQFLLKRGLKLLWTSHSLDSLGEESSVDLDGPITWEQSERRILRAEIDAVIAQVYGLDKNEFSRIIDSFDILRDREEEEYGEYRRKRECLEMFDQIEVK